MSNPYARHNEQSKANFDHVYDLPDPRGYFEALGSLDYLAPEHARRLFPTLLREVRSGDGPPCILDLCCSYGVNAALLCEDGRAPWVATLPARLVDYGPLSDLFSRHGFVTEKLSARTFPQRRFADAAEREHVLRELTKMGLDPAGREEEGWYHADLYLSRPATEAAKTPVDELFGAPGTLDY